MATIWCEQYECKYNQHRGWCEDAGDIEVIVCANDTTCGIDETGEEIE